MKRPTKITWLIIAAILSIFILFGCASKEKIKIPVSKPEPHPKLAHMQSMSIEEKDGVIYFGESKKYKKRGITVVSLKGEPYEIGYAHGVLLKDEMKPWIKEALYFMKTRSFGTSGLQNKLIGRAKEIEPYIPDRYVAELKGLAAGSGIDNDVILMLNTAETTAKAYFCTSVVVKNRDGNLIRSRSLETTIGLMLKPLILFIYQPSEGYAFSSVTIPGMIGTWTAMNETGLNYGQHAIWKADSYKKGMPNTILGRKIIETANSVEAVDGILINAPRARPEILLVSDSKSARTYEYDAEDVGLREFAENRLIQTNYTKVLKIGASYTCQRYLSASNFLNNLQAQMDVFKLVELNRSDAIACVHNRYDNHHLAIFMPKTLDFWIAVDPPPASRGRWVGFNLKKELDGSGHEPNPLIIPAMSLKFSSR